MESVICMDGIVKHGWIQYLCYSSFPFCMTTYLVTYSCPATA